MADQSSSPEMSLHWNHTSKPCETCKQATYHDHDGVCALCNPVFVDHDNYGDLMTVQDWLDCVKCGGFIDYDGHGCLATEEKQTNYDIQPSDAANGFVFPTWATHIRWYNR